MTRELDQLQLEMYNDSTLYNNNIEVFFSYSCLLIIILYFRKLYQIFHINIVSILQDLQISEKEDDNEGKTNQEEDIVDDIVVLENMIEKDEEERQEIVSTTSIIMSTKDDNDNNDGDDLMGLTNN